MFLLRVGCAALVAVGLFGAPAAADSVFEISGSPIAGEDPSFLPHVKAEIQIVSSTQFTILLTNLSAAESSIGQVLTAFLWDLDGFSGTVAPVSATLPSGSVLQGKDATGATDVSPEWFFRDDISAGSTYAGPLGSYGAGVMGKINLGADTFGVNDKFASGNLFSIDGPNGIEVGIVGPNIVLYEDAADLSLNPDGFKKQGPVAQNKMLLTFSYTGTLNLAMFENGQFLFGSDGAPVVPEPGTFVLLGVALAAFGLSRRRRGARR